MTDFSHIARARLAKVPVAGPHPDAGLLTAFAERSLAGREREGVLAHLATCADCREVVTLAAPEPIAGLEALAPASKTPRWLTMPVMRWGAVAAAVAVVAVAVVLQSPRLQSPAPFHANKSLAVATAEKAPQAQSPTIASAGKASAGSERDRAASALRAAEVKQNEVQVGQTRQDESATKKDDLAKQKKEESAHTLAAAAPARSADAGRLAGNVAGGSVMAQAERNEPFKDAKLARRPAEQPAAARSKPAAPATASDSTDAYAYDAAKSAPSPEAAPGSGSAGSYGPGYAGGTMASSAPAASGVRAQLRPAALRWTVTSDGRVQRSLDGGRNWADVPIARDKDKPVKFRALTTDGDQVWVGGARGALYYSADAGGTWRPHPIERVTGDIIRLNVNGKTLIISTSSGQTIEVSHDAFGDAAAKPPSNR